MEKAAWQNNAAAKIANAAAKIANAAAKIVNTAVKFEKKGFELSCQIFSRHSFHIFGTELFS